MHVVVIILFCLSSKMLSDDKMEPGAGEYASQIIGAKRNHSECRSLTVLSFTNLLATSAHNFFTIEISY